MKSKFQFIDEWRLPCNEKRMGNDSLECKPFPIDYRRAKAWLRRIKGSSFLILHSSFNHPLLALYEVDT